MGLKSRNWEKLIPLANRPAADTSVGEEVARVQEDSADQYAERVRARLEVWNTSTLAWDRMTQPGGVGGGGGGPATIADGADVAQGTTTDPSTSNTVIGLLKAVKAAVTGTLTVATHAVTQSGAWTTGRTWTLASGTDSVNVGNFPGTQAVSGSVTADTELPAAAALADAAPSPTAPAVGAFGMLWNGATWDRAPGSAAAGLKVQGTVAVSNFPATQAVSIAATIPVSGPLTDAQLRAAVVPVSSTDNLAQIGGTALAAKALPANADGQVAIPVYVNAQQYATYDVAMRNIATGILTTNTAKPVMSFEHALASTKTVRIRRIMIHALQTSALAGAFDLQIMKGTAASSAGTAVVPNPRKGGDPASEMVVKSLPTIVAATLGDVIPVGGFATTTTLYSPPVLAYDWQESGETKPLILRAGVLESIVLNIISVQALNLTLTISVDFTEE